MLGCSKDWAAASWTVRSLLERGDGEWMWKANFVDKSGMVNDTSEQVTINTCTMHFIIRC